MADVIQAIPETQNNLPQLWKDVSGNESYFAQLVVSQPVASVSKTIISQNGTVNNSGTQNLVAAGVFSSQVTIQNVDPANVLYVSANNPATVNDIELLPTASVTLPFGIANAIYGLSSGTSTKFAVIGA